MDRFLAPVSQRSRYQGAPPLPLYGTPENVPRAACLATGPACCRSHRGSHRSHRAACAPCRPVTPCDRSPAARYRSHAQRLQCARAPGVRPVARPVRPVTPNVPHSVLGGGGHGGDFRLRARRGAGRRLLEVRGCAAGRGRGWSPGDRSPCDRSHGERLPRIAPRAAAECSPAARSAAKRVVAEGSFVRAVGRGPLGCRLLGGRPVREPPAWQATVRPPRTRLATGSRATGGRATGWQATGTRNVRDVRQASCRPCDRSLPLYFCSVPWHPWDSNPRPLGNGNQVRLLTH